MEREVKNGRKKDRERETDRENKRIIENASRVKGKRQCEPE
jgi:hypothetical protein